MEHIPYFTRRTWNVLLAKTNPKRNSFQAWNKKLRQIFNATVHIIKYVQNIFAVWRQFNKPEVK